ncbi:hypothetical protein EDD21DRAFT_380861 [Dissophora ornata]|nr:hypothetical protein EDD21DRAFT_380861 [Dissophora ornata]
MGLAAMIIMLLATIPMLAMIPMLPTLPSSKRSIPARATTRATSTVRMLLPIPPTPLPRPWEADLLVAQESLEVGLLDILPVLPSTQCSPTTTATITTA